MTLHPLDQVKVPTIPDGYLDSIPLPARNSVTRKKEQINLDVKVARKAIQAYYASISFADAQLGRILATLDATGLSKNTIVLFTSDHGYHMGEHGHYQKTTLFENAARVPLIVAGPEIVAGKTAGTMAEMVDFYPTLAELADLPTPKFLSGVSLAPALRDPSATPRLSALTHYANGYSIRTQDYRFTQWGENGVEGNELYDHRNDPGEMKNLADDPHYAQIVEELATTLKTRIVDAQKPPTGIKQNRFADTRKVPQR